MERSALYSFGPYDEERSSYLITLEALKDDCGKKNLLPKSLEFNLLKLLGLPLGIIMCTYFEARQLECTHVTNS